MAALGAWWCSDKWEKKQGIVRIGKEGRKIVPFHIFSALFTLLGWYLSEAKVGTSREHARTLLSLNASLLLPWSACICGFYFFQCYLASCGVHHSSIHRMISKMKHWSRRCHGTLACAMRAVFSALAMPGFERRTCRGCGAALAACLRFPHVFPQLQSNTCLNSLNMSVPSAYQAPGVCIFFCQGVAEDLPCMEFVWGSRSHLRPIWSWLAIMIHDASGIPRIGINMY